MGQKAPGDPSKLCFGMKEGEWYLSNGWCGLVAMELLTVVSVHP